MDYSATKCIEHCRGSLGDANNSFALIEHVKCQCGTAHTIDLAAADSPVKSKGDCSLSSAYQMVGDSSGSNVAFYDLNHQDRKYHGDLKGPRSCQAASDELMLTRNGVKDLMLQHHPGAPLVKSFCDMTQAGVCHAPLLFGLPGSSFEGVGVGSEGNTIRLDNKEYLAYKSIPIWRSANLTTYDSLKYKSNSWCWLNRYCYGRYDSSGKVKLMDGFGFKITFPEVKLITAIWWSTELYEGRNSYLHKIKEIEFNAPGSVGGGTLKISGTDTDHLVKDHDPNENYKAVRTKFRFKFPLYTDSLTFTGLVYGGNDWDYGHDVRIQMELYGCPYPDMTRTFCPRGSYPGKTVCYEVVETVGRGLNYSEAKSICASKGAFPAEAMNDNANSELKTLLTNSTLTGAKFWIGVQNGFNDALNTTLWEFFNGVPIMDFHYSKWAAR